MQLEQYFSFNGDMLTGSSLPAQCPESPVD